MKLWTELKNQCRRVTPLELALQDLEEAEMEKFKGDTAREHADATVAYNITRIARLKKFIAAATREEAK